VDKKINKWELLLVVLMIFFTSGALMILFPHSIYPIMGNNLDNFEKFARNVARILYTTRWLDWYAVIIYPLLITGISFYFRYSNRRIMKLFVHAMLVISLIGISSLITMVHFVEARDMCILCSNAPFSSGFPEAVLITTIPLLPAILVLIGNALSSNKHFIKN
jgi:hypothetical protein